METQDRGNRARKGTPHHLRVTGLGQQPLIGAGLAVAVAWPPWGRRCGLRRLDRAGNGPAPDTFSGASDGDGQCRRVPDDGRPPLGSMPSCLGGAPRPQSPSGQTRERVNERPRRRAGARWGAVVVGPELGDRTWCPRQQNGGTKHSMADVAGAERPGCGGRGGDRLGGVRRRTR